MTNKKILWIGAVLGIGLSVLFVWAMSDNKEDIIKGTFLTLIIWAVTIGGKKSLDIQVWPPPKVEGDASQVARANYLHYRRLTKIIATGLAGLFTAIWLVGFILVLILYKVDIHRSLSFCGRYLTISVVLYCLPWAVFYLFYWIKAARQKI